MGLGNCSTLLGRRTRGIGAMGREAGLVWKALQTAKSMKGIGKITNTADMGRLSPMSIPTSVIGRMAKRRGLASRSLRTDADMRETSWKTIERGTVQ
jgi:hypothetical protein